MLPIFQWSDTNLRFFYKFLAFVVSEILGVCSWLEGQDTTQIMRFFILIDASFMMSFATLGAVHKAFHTTQILLEWKQSVIRYI